MTTKPQSRSVQQKSPQRIAVERVLESPTGDKWMTNREIQFSSGVDIKKVTEITGVMLFKGTAESRKVNGKTQYRLATRKAELTQPMNGPGHTMKPLGKLVDPTEKPIRNSTSTDDYVPHELAPFDGREGAMDASKQFSLVNGIRIEPKRITAMCVGAAEKFESSGGQRRYSV